MRWIPAGVVVALVSVLAAPRSALAIYDDLCPLPTWIHPGVRSQVTALPPNPRLVLFVPDGSFPDIEAYADGAPVPAVLSPFSDVEGWRGTAMSVRVFTGNAQTLRLRISRNETPSLYGGATGLPDQVYVIDPAWRASKPEVIGLEHVDNREGCPPYDSLRITVDSRAIAYRVEMPGRTVIMPTEYFLTWDMGDRLSASGPLDPSEFARLPHDLVIDGCHGTPAASELGSAPIILTALYPDGSEAQVGVVRFADAVRAAAWHTMPLRIWAVERPPTKHLREGSVPILGLVFLFFLAPAGGVGVAWLRIRRRRL